MGILQSFNQPRKEYYMNHRFELYDVVQSVSTTGKVKARFTEEDKNKYIVEELGTKVIKVFPEGSLRRISMQ